MAQKNYSLWSLLQQGFKRQEGWDQAWRNPPPKSSYDVVIVGAGGHGLATAYYLAKEHGIKNIAVLAKGYLGAATRPAIPPSSARITCETTHPCRTSTRSGCGKACRRRSTST